MAKTNPKQRNNQTETSRQSLKMKLTLNWAQCEPMKFPVAYFTTTPDVSFIVVHIELSLARLASDSVSQDNKFCS